MPDSIRSRYRSKKRLNDLECLRCLCRKHKSWDLNSGLPVYLGTRYYSVKQAFLDWKSCLWAGERWVQGLGIVLSQHVACDSGFDLRPAIGLHGSNLPTSEWPC